MRRPRAAWLTVLETYPCRTCGAQVGQPCTAKTGTELVRYTHADRGREAVRCAVCFSQLPEGAAPGDLCPRCGQVRALEVERATKYVRRDGQ